MAIKSSLVTAKSSAAVKKYELVKSKNIGKTYTVDNKANTYYWRVHKSYSTIIKCLASIATEFEKCAKSTIEGDEIQATLKKIARTCARQSGYCKDRKNDAEKYWAYTQNKIQSQTLVELLKNTASLQEKVDKFEELLKQHGISF